MATNAILKHVFGDAPYQMLVEELEDFAVFHIDPAGIIISYFR